MAEDGTVSRPFVIPQQEADYYTLLMQSYNIPEFIAGKVEMPKEKLLDAIKNREPVKVRN